jgi:hypothetical protein
MQKDDVWSRLAAPLNADDRSGVQTASRRPATANTSPALSPTSRRIRCANDWTRLCQGNGI